METRVEKRGDCEGGSRFPGGDRVARLARLARLARVKAISQFANPRVRTIFQSPVPCTEKTVKESNDW